MYIEMEKRQSGSTWEKVPTISGSRWGFIGAMAGVLVVLILLLLFLICCIKRRRSRRKMKYASHGSDLHTYHPEPTPGRRPNRFASTEHEETNAFVNTSPGQSFDYDEQTGNNVRMQSMNNRPYRGQDAFETPYHGYAPNSYGGGGYDYGQDGQFVEPVHYGQGSQYASAQGGAYGVAQDEFYASPHDGHYMEHHTNPSSAYVTPVHTPGLPHQYAPSEHSYAASHTIPRIPTPARHTPHQYGTAYAPEAPSHGDMVGYSAPSEGMEHHPPPYIPYQQREDDPSGGVNIPPRPEKSRMDGTDV